MEDFVIAQKNTVITLMEKVKTERATSASSTK